VSPVPWALLALVLGASGTFSQQIADLKPATLAGAKRVVTLFHDNLLQAPFQVETKYRTACGRFVPVATQRLLDAPDRHCVDCIRALEASAMCAWFNEENGTLLRSLERLVTRRCPKEGVEGLERALRLAERWLWPAAVGSYIDAQQSDQAAVEMRKERLKNLNVRYRAVLKAFGPTKTIKGGGLLVTHVAPDVPAARTGLRKGDVIVNVNARPMQGQEELTRLLGEGKAVPFMFMRAGIRHENTWFGGVQGLSALPLPERVIRGP
jgi:hypothetical protein